MATRLPKPTPPTAKDTRGIMEPTRKAKQPKVMDTRTRPATKKSPKQKIVTAGQGRRTLTTVD